MINILGGVSLTLLTSENVTLFKSFGILFFFALAIYGNKVNNFKFALLRLKKLLAINMIFLYSIAISLSCLMFSFVTIAGLIIKCVVISCFFLSFTNERISKFIEISLYIHVSFFFLHVVFLFLGLDHYYDLFLGFPAQTNFSESSYIPFRATGLFDEPSTFGMSILSLVISLYFIGDRLRFSKIPFFTFSVPVMVVSASLMLTRVDRISIVKKLLIFSIVSLLALIIVVVGADREQNVKESPIGLRTSHLLFLYESPNLLYGSGFCSAYGRFPLDLDRDSLREHMLANFKDAGQVVYGIDRVGVIFFVLFGFGILFYWGGKKAMLLFLYLALSKVPLIGTPVIFLLCSLAVSSGRKQNLMDR